MMGNVALAMFVLEILLRIYAFGVREYLSAPMHVLDIFCATIGGFFFLLELFSSSSHHGTKGNSAANETSPLYNLSLVLRASRMLRLLWFVPSLQGMLWTIAMLLPSLVELLTILFVPMYFFGCLGHLFFGHCMIEDPAFYNHTLTPMMGRNETTTALAKWAPYQNMLQFDSPGRGLLMMFEVSTISSWNAFADAGAALCSSWGAPLFFFIVRIILNMIFVPIIAGYILESFVKKFEFYGMFFPFVRRVGVLLFFSFFATRN